MANGSSDPVFSFIFRRYAPFARFGRANPLTLGFGYFEGDDRGVSTSQRNTTSRTYGIVFFNRSGPLRLLAGSSGTTFHPAIGDPIVGMAKVGSTLVRDSLAGPDLFSFRASTAGSNPLVPASPDIDTIVHVRIDFGAPKALRITGEVFGDNFPNLEIFILCYHTNQTALLLDGRTGGGRNTGPMLHLWGEGNNNLLARFSAGLTLDERGEMPFSTTVGPTDI
jgi:hypothetical protein